MPLQDADVNAITSRLDVIIKLMTSLYAREMGNGEAIVKLDRMKLTREQIADSLGVTTANVKQVIYLSRKNEKKSDKKAKKVEAAVAEAESSAEPSDTAAAVEEA